MASRSLPSEAEAWFSSAAVEELVASFRCVSLSDMLASQEPDSITENLQTALVYEQRRNRLLGSMGVVETV
jgi:hypothetical protein